MNSNEIDLLNRTSMTDKEKELIMITVDLWNKYLQLPVSHPMDRSEFASKIHGIQDHIAARHVFAELNKAHFGDPCISQIAEPTPPIPPPDRQIIEGEKFPYLAFSGIVLLICACLMAIAKISGWGWFLVIAVLCLASSKWESFGKKIIYGCEAYGNANRVYLVRYTIFSCPWFQICFHVFHASDWTEDFHDHPWPFVSLILWRGYIEQTPDGKRKRQWPGMILFRKATHQHRVELLKTKSRLKFRRRPWPGHAETVRPKDKKAITLVVMGKRCRQWYFYTKGVKTLWTRYFSLKGCK